MLGLEAEKTFLSCFEAGRKILCGRGNLILLFCELKYKKMDDVSKSGAGNIRKI